MELAALCVLFAVDAALAGYRASAGRNPRVRKVEWYRYHAVLGLAAGLGVDILVVALVLLLGVDVRPAAVAMLQVFVPYASAVLFAMLLWYSRSLDVQVLSSVLVLGPFTLLRPFVIVGGVAWGFAQVPSVGGAVIAFVLIAAALGLGPMLRPQFVVPASS